MPWPFRLATRPKRRAIRRGCIWWRLPPHHGIISGSKFPPPRYRPPP
jgi:hypothetical protein